MSLKVELEVIGQVLQSRVKIVQFSAMDRIHVMSTSRALFVKVVDASSSDQAYLLPYIMHSFIESVQSTYKPVESILSE